MLIRQCIDHSRNHQENGIGTLFRFLQLFFGAQEWRYLSKKLRHLKCNGSSEGKFYASYTVTKVRSDGIQAWKKVLAVQGSLYKRFSFSTASDSLAKINTITTWDLSTPVQDAEPTFYPHFCFAGFPQSLPAMHAAAWSTTWNLETWILQLLLLLAWGGRSWCGFDVAIIFLSRALKYKSSCSFSTQVADAGLCILQFVFLFFSTKAKDQTFTVHDSTMRWASGKKRMR